MPSHDNHLEPHAVTTPPRAVIEQLATRCRAGGQLLLALDKQGAVTFCDPEAAPFLRLCASGVFGAALPNSVDITARLREAIGLLTTGSPVTGWDFVPGLVAAAFPIIEKRQMQGVVVLAGKTRTFTIDDEIRSLCSQLAIETDWLDHQAAEVPGFDDVSIRAIGEMVLGMMRDQLRLCTMEAELTSLSSQLSNSYEELSLIYQVSGGMKVNRTAPEFFKQACLDVRDVMNVRAMGVVLCGEGSCRQPPALYGEVQLSADHLARLSDELMNVLRDRKSPLLVNDVATDKRFGWAGRHFRHLIAVPLQRQDQVLGCLFGVDKSQGDFDSVDSKLLNSIANESAIYLENARLFEDVRNLMMGILHSLTSAVDAKDAYTCGHSERVALLSGRLAREIGLPPQQVERIYISAILHDVGKIGVPEAVLQKAGKLTNAEYELMKRHPEIGARILQDIKQVADIVPGVMHHHERYDGKGYPHRLSGQDIPLMGRIICLADCFDAMTSNRTYRRALPLEVAMIELRRCAGTQFDPRLTEAFLRISPDELRSLLHDHQVRAKQRIEAVVPEFVKAA